MAQTYNNDYKIFQDDCPFGCPCDRFDCHPDKKSVLVLNTFSSSNKPVLIKFDGEFDLNVKINRTFTLTHTAPSLH